MTPKMKLEVERSRDRNCGPRAVAEITGWPVDRVVLHIRALRERAGKRMSLRGGTYATEQWSALEAAGWTVERATVRTTLADLGKGEASTWWLCYQPGHVFAFQRRTDAWIVRDYGRVRVRAHRVRRIRRSAAVLP